MKSSREGRVRDRGVRRRGAMPTGWLLALGVVMAGCSGGSGSAEPSAGGATGGASPAASASPTLELASPKSPVAGGNTYTGVLRSDPIEGGCVYVQAADGQKYEVIPPDGWQLQKAPAAFVSPDGQVVAKAGDRVTVHGSEADMVSICQVGPIIQATDIVAGG